MCGYDLRNQPQRRRRFSWVDFLLVVAVLVVLVFWWRIGTESAQDGGQENGIQGILPTSVPLLAATPTPQPTTTPVPTAPPPPPVTETGLLKHVVQGGESLLSIAIQYGVSVEEIQQANGLTSELIRVGDELTIPVVQRKYSSTSPAVQPSNFSYTVEQGDTLIAISLKFGSTVDEIQTANELAGNALILPGDQLIIPVRGAPPEALAVTPAPTTAPAAANSAGPQAVIYSEPA